MKRQFLQYSLAIIFMVLNVSRAAESQPMTPKDFVIRYEKALATQQWDHVEPLIHPNCSVTFSNGTFHQGKEAVREAFQRNFALIEDEAYSISDLHWTFKDHNFAVFTYSFKWSGKINGKNASGNGRGTSTLKNEHGTWQLVSEHLGPKS